MKNHLKASTLTVSIHCPAEKVYAFVSDLKNLPIWAAAFAKSIESIEGKWVIQTDQGPVGIRMCDKNNFGILDHYVSPAPGVEIYVPMRVIPHGAGSEVTFTLLQTPEMSDERFAQDSKFVRRDLDSLKQVLEK